MVEWKMNRFNGALEHELRMKVYLDKSGGKKQPRPPIEVFFEIPMYTTSGVKVR